jgi:S-adenosylmethionine hydrolase
LKTGEVGLVVDSYGLLAVSVDRGSAATELGLHAGDPVTLEPFADEEDNSVPIRLGNRR